MADPKIRYDIAANVTGSADIQRLHTDLEKLAQSLEGDLKREALNAAAALREIGGQQSLIAQFRAQKDAVEEAANALREKQQAAQELGKTYAALKTPTASQTKEFERAKTAVRQSKQAYIDSHKSLQELRRALQQSGVDTGKLADASQKLRGQLQQVTGSIGKLSQEANQAAAVQQALGTLGVRSAKEIAAEISKTRAAMQTLQGASRSTGQAIDQAMHNGQQRIKLLEREMRELNGTMTMADRAAKLFSSNLGQVFGGNLLANAFSSAAGYLQGLGRQFIQVGIESERTQKAFNAIYKDTKIAAEQMEFLRKTAQGAGVEIDALRQPFISFAASTQAANIPLAVANDLFASVTKAGATLGLSSDAVSRALTALAQMAAKGTVSMEELRGQLGEALPGALSLAANGLGMTEQELIALVSSGKLAARDLFPALAQQLKTMHGDTDTLAGSFARLKNSITIALEAMSSGDRMSGINGLFKVFVWVVGKAAMVLVGFSEATTLAGKGIGALAATIDILARGSGSMSERLAQVKEIWRDMSDQAAASGERIAKVKDAFEEQGEAATASAKATDKAAASVTGLGAAWQSTSNEAAKAQGALKENIDLLEKTQKASKASAENIVAEAKARGDHAGILDAEARAAEINAQAATALASEHQKLAAAMADELQQKQAMLANSPDEAAARDKEIKDLQAKVEATREVAAEKENLARAAELEAQAKALAIQTDRDNSQSLQDYATALTIAKGAVAALELEHRAGNATAEDVRKARDQLTAAEVMYQDALKDSIRMQEAKAQAEMADLSLAKAGLSVEMERAKGDAQRAKRMGDEAALTRALIKQKDIQIKMAELEVKMEHAKADAAIASAKARMAQLEAEGKLTEAERISIESAIKVAKAQKELVKVREENIKLMKEERSEMIAGNGALDNRAGRYEKVANAANKAANAIDQLNNKSRESGGSGGNGGGGGGGGQVAQTEQRGSAGVIDHNARRNVKSAIGRAEPQKADLSFHFDAQEARDKGKLHTLSDAQLEGFIKMAKQHQQAYAAGASYGAFSFEGRRAVEKEVAAARDMEEELQRRRYAEHAKASAKVDAEIAAMQLAPGHEAQQQPVQQRTYQINMPGYGSINTDKAGADAVESLMKALERGKAATGRRL